MRLGVAPRAGEEGEGAASALSVLERADAGAGAGAGRMFDSAIGAGTRAARAGNTTLPGRRATLSFWHSQEWQVSGAALLPAHPTRHPATGSPWFRRADI